MKSINYELDEHLRFKNVDATLAKIFGAKPDQLEGKRFDVMITQSCAPNFLEAALEAFRGNPVNPLRIEIIQNQRKKIDVEMSLKPVEPDRIEAVKGLKGTMKFLKERVEC